MYQNPIKVIDSEILISWIRCRRLMAWLREIGVEFISVVVKTDNEPALVKLIETWSSMRTMGGGSRAW